MTTGKRFILFAVLMSGWIFHANAQSVHLTAKSMALGGGGTAYVDNYHANFINPANLLLGSDEPRTTIGLIGGISSTVGGPLANIHVYNNYFTKGLVLTGKTAQEALTKWFGTDPAEMANLTMQTDIVPVGLSFRGNNWAIGLALRSRILMNTGISKGFAQLGIHGFDAEIFGNGRPVNFTLETMTFYEASVGFSFKVLEIEDLGFAKNIRVYAGAAPKLLLGANTFKFDFNSILTLEGEDKNAIDEIRHDFDYRLETTGEISKQLTEYYRARESQADSPGIDDYVDPAPEDFYGIHARGLGFDLGATIEMDLNVPIIGAITKGTEHLQVGISLTDLGSLSFSEKAGIFVADDELAWRGFELDYEKIDKEYNGDSGEYISHVLQDSIMTGIYGSYAPVNNAIITRYLPTMLHFGGYLSLNKLGISIDLTKGVTKNAITSHKLALSTGLEYNLLGFFPLRVGIRTGGYSSTSYSAGFGLEFRYFEFSLAGSMVRNSLQNGTHFGAAWSGLVIKF